MTRHISLPNRKDGAEGLLALADREGAMAVYELILLCRTNRGRDAGGEALTALAHRLVAAEMEKTNADFETARRQVATKIYDEPTSRTNFYKILQGGRNPDTRPSSRYRNQDEK